MRFGRSLFIYVTVVSCCMSCSMVLFLHSQHDHAALHAAVQSALTTKLLRYQPVYQQHHASTENKRSRTRATMKILYYTVFMNLKHWFGLGREPFAGCAYSACETTSDKSQLSRADAVLVNDVDIPPGFFDSLPTTRNPAQKWILSMSESPINTLMMYSSLNDIMNLTLNYKLSAGLYTPYFVIARREQTLAPFPRSFSASKTKLVAWFSSHCATQSKREDYVNQLQKHIPVDVYGTCGSLECPKDFNHMNKGTPGPDKCDRHLNATYKFYLSFENSLCQDYITEKVSRILRLDVVPIVLGGADYAKHLPPHSYINVKDFKSARHLADYLKVLDADDALYQEYFEWKRYFRVEVFNRACSLCEYLHVHSAQRSTLTDIDAQWNYKDCVSPEDYFKGIM